MKKILVLLLTLIFGGNIMLEAKDWDKTFPEKENVTIKKVTFKNCFLYLRRVIV